MATLASLTLDVEDMLYGMAQVERPPEVTLATAVDDTSDVTWQFAENGTALLVKDTYVEEVTSDGSAGEVIILAEDSVASSDVTVRRSQQRTTAAGGFSIGDVFRVNPTYTRVKIQRFINDIINNNLWPDVWLRTRRSLDINQGRFYYPLNADDYEVETVYQADVSVTAVGDATFDMTGGASEDLWTLTDHGLAVGDAVRFTAVGTGAEPYAVNTVYWVAAVPSSSTFQLSATESTTVLEGTGADSSGTWTLEKIDVFSFDPIPSTAWEVQLYLDDRFTNATAGSIRLLKYYDVDQTLYYVAKTKPQSSSISSLTSEMANIVPYGVLWLMLSGTRVVPTRIDSRNPAVRETMSAAQPLADSRFFRDEFDRRKGELRRQLEAERYPRTYLKRSRVVRK